MEPFTLSTGRTVDGDFNFTSWAQVSSQLFSTIKTIGYKVAWLPLLLERVGVRRIKSRNYMPLIPAFPATAPALPYYPYSCR